MSSVSYLGQISLEIYVIHFYLLNIITVYNIHINSIQGIVSLMMNYILDIVFTLMIIYILRQNKLCMLLLFGKTK